MQVWASWAAWGVQQIKQNQLANQQRQAQVQLTQQKAAQYPADRAAWRQRLDTATQYAYARAQAEGHKILKTTVDADGNVSVFSQTPWASHSTARW